MSTLENSLLGRSLGALAGQALENQNSLNTANFSQWLAAPQQQFSNGINEQQQFINANMGAQFALQQRDYYTQGYSYSRRLDNEGLERYILNMNWTCTNPNCGKPLELAKRGKDKFQPKGVLILECKHCGFEFAVQAEVERRPKKENRLTKTDFDLAALKKKVKEFELQ